MDFFTGTSHSFDTGIATEYGEKAALLIHNFQLWINYNARLGKNFIEERTWSYGTIEEIAAPFEYYSTDQIRRILDKLVDKKVLKKGNYNETQYKRTLWYSFENEKMFRIRRNCQMELAKLPNGYGEIAKCNKDICTNTCTKKNKKKSLPPASTAAQEVASLLLKKLKERNPKMVFKSLTQWPTQIDEMMRLDKRTLEETKSVIELTFSQDYFWGKPIKSPTSLRKFFDRVMEDIIHPPKAKREENQREKKLKDEQINQKWITPLTNFSFNDRERRISISSQGIGIHNGRDYESVPYSSPGFKPTVLHRLKTWGMTDIMERMESTI